MKFSKMQKLIKKLEERYCPDCEQVLDIDQNCSHTEPNPAAYATWSEWRDALNDH